MIEELAELAQGRDDVRTECADTLAGSWSASPASSYAEELVAAGLLLLARPVDGGGNTEGQRGFHPTPASIELLRSEPP